jgi:hypothetical protein
MNRDPLHELFERAAPPTASPAHTRQALDGLRPGFEGALRRQRLRLGAAVTAATVALAGGAAALGAIGPDSNAELDPSSPTPHTSIGDAEIVEDALDPPGDDQPTGEAPGSEGSRTETAGPTPTADPAPPGDDDTPEPGDDDTPEPDDETDEHKTDDDTDDHKTDDDTDDDTDDHATDDDTEATEPDADPLTGTTPGGSVTVSFDDGVITIESIDEEPGFTSDVTEEEPQEVKVYFYGNGEEYEVEIKVEHGELGIEAEQSSS